MDVNQGNKGIRREFGRKTHVLLAEDNEVNRKLATLLLEDSGYRISSVTNGQEAVDALKENEYDIVLMDVEMPGMDGLTATEIIRDPGSGVINNTITIIAMTAHALDEDRQRCLDAGMDDFVSKPILSHDLVQVIEKNL